jgi:hypothetical protein
MVLVCDAAALLELARRSLLAQLLALPLAVAVTDVLAADTRFTSNGLDWPTLRRLGLRVEAVDDHGVKAAAACLGEWPMLSSHDCFSVALASRRGWPLLTQHGCVAAAALRLGVAVRDLRWLGQQAREHACRPPTRPGTALCPALRCHWGGDDRSDCPYRRATCPAPVERYPAA